MSEQKEVAELKRLAREGVVTLLRDTGKFPEGEAVFIGFVGNLMMSKIFAPPVKVSSLEEVIAFLAPIAKESFIENPEWSFRQVYWSDRYKGYFASIHLAEAEPEEEA